MTMHSMTQRWTIPGKIRIKSQTRLSLMNKGKSLVLAVHTTSSEFPSAVWAEEGG